MTKPTSWRQMRGILKLYQRIDEMAELRAANERLRAALEWAAGKLGAHGFPDLAHQARSRAVLGEGKKG